MASTTVSPAIWHYGAAAARVALHDGHCAVGLHGPITRDVLDRLHLDMVVRLRGAPIYAFMIDWRRALCAVTSEDLDASLLAYAGELSTPPTTRLWLPCVHIVLDALADTFNRHAFNMIDPGLTRVAVTGLVPALEFTQRHVAWATIR